VYKSNNVQQIFYRSMKKVTPWRIKIYEILKRAFVKLKILNISIQCNISTIWMYLLLYNFASWQKRKLRHLHVQKRAFTERSLLEACNILLWKRYRKPCKGCKSKNLFKPGNKEEPKGTVALDWICLKVIRLFYRPWLSLCFFIRLFTPSS